MNGERAALTHVIVGLVAVLVPYAIFDYQNQPRPHYVELRDDDDSDDQFVTFVNESPYIPVAATRLSFVVTDKDDLKRLKRDETEYYIKMKSAKSLGVNQYDDDPDLFTFGQWREDGYLQFSISRRFDIGPGKTSDVRVGIVNDKWANTWISGVLYLHFNEQDKTYPIKDVRLWVQPRKSVDKNQTASLPISTVR